MAYKDVKKDKIHRLINVNPLLLISTVSKDKKYDIAPIAWVCPQEIDPPRLLTCIDKGHQTYKNIKETKNFVACIPNIKQVDIVKKAGSVSGSQTDKFENFKINSFIDKETGCKIPEDVIAYLRCRIKDVIYPSAVIIADVISAQADEDAFAGDYLKADNPKGKVIYHLGGDKFVTFGNQIL
ncbi:MAG: flavin reductase family protein [Candidatus Goldbacteria bacterium]|nr:flavin reductase family protein [Candidatus Goldiibacteriota bacterium]